MLSENSFNIDCAVNGGKLRYLRFILIIYKLAVNPKTPPSSTVNARIYIGVMPQPKPHQLISNNNEVNVGTKPL